MYKRMLLTAAGLGASVGATLAFVTRMEYWVMTFTLFASAVFCVAAHTTLEVPRHTKFKYMPIIEVAVVIFILIYFVTISSAISILIFVAATAAVTHGIIYYITFKIIRHAKKHGGWIYFVQTAAPAVINIGGFVAFAIADNWVAYLYSATACANMVYVGIIIYLI